MVFKRAFPHLEDQGAVAGGDTSALLRPMGRHVPVTALGAPPGEDPLTTPPAAVDEIENAAAAAATEGVEGEAPPEEIDFLKLIREAENQATLYMGQVNRRAWTQSYRAFHNEHFTGAKYTRKEWANRSKIFRPKTRSAVRKDMAAVAASMFGTVDAVNCSPGNEADPRQRAAAAVMKELLNYRTSRNSNKAAIPWFQVAMGARQDSLLTGICLSKQCWKLDIRQDGEEEVPGPDGLPVKRPAYVIDVDRPDSCVIAPENFVMSPTADWTNPVQSASYIIIRWPMQIEEIRQKQRSPIDPWKDVPEDVLRGAVDTSKFDAAAMRRAREMGLDRMDETQTGQEFQIVWVYETYMRVDGEDWTFFSVGDKDYLTDPRPVREVYPEQFGERPLTLGYGALESHRIFPMAPVESWQMLQLEINDLANLALDAIKQNVMPVTKIRRGRQVDLDQVRRRASGSSIMVTEPDDVTWDRPPDVPQSVPVMNRELELEFDDLAGQFNGQTAESNNALSRTLGGLKLVAGSANAVQEFDIRVWIQTWVEPTLMQLVRLEQWFESDPVVLGLCGERAQLFQKYGLNEIDDKLLEEEVTISVSAGLGSGDPQQRLAKFQMAATVAAPLLQNTPQFRSGEWQLDAEAVMEEVFGAAGYRDGGMRFIKKGQPMPANPLQDLEADKIKSETEKNRATAKSSLLSGLAAVAKVAQGDAQLESDNINMLLEHRQRATETGFAHGQAQRDNDMAQADMGHRHGMEIAGHKQGIAQSDREHAMREREFAAQQAGAEAESVGRPKAKGGGASGGAAAPAPAPRPEGTEAPPPEAASPQQGAPQQRPAPQARPVPIAFKFERDPRTGRIAAAIPIYAPEPGAGPALPPPSAGAPEKGPVPLPPRMRGKPAARPGGPSSGRPGREIDLQSMMRSTGV